MFLRTAETYTILEHFSWPFPEPGKNSFEGLFICCIIHIWPSCRYRETTKVVTYINGIVLDVSVFHGLKVISYETFTKSPKPEVKSYAIFSLCVHL